MIKTREEIQFFVLGTTDLAYMRVDHYWNKRLHNLSKILHQLKDI